MAVADPGPLPAHLRAEQIFSLVELLWPFALTACIGVLRWKRLDSRAGFLVVGVLGCFGLQAFLARLIRYLVWTYFAPMQARYFATALHLSDPIVVILVSATLSVPLLMWLAELLGVRPSDLPR